MSGTESLKKKFVPSEELLRHFTQIALIGQHVSHSPSGGDADFKQDGLRSYALYRNLGVDAATNGLVQAHVLKMVEPYSEKARIDHIHVTVFQMIYVLKGSTTISFDGGEPVKMMLGSCWTQPPSIRHVVLDYSDDFDALEILLPADFDTVNF